MNKRQAIRRNKEKIDELEKQVELLGNILSELKEESKKDFKIKTFDQKEDNDAEERE